MASFLLLTASLVSLDFYFGDGDAVEAGDCCTAVVGLIRICSVQSSSYITASLLLYPLKGWNDRNAPPCLAHALVLISNIPQIPNTPCLTKYVASNVAVVLDTWDLSPQKAEIGGSHI